MDTRQEQLLTLVVENYITTAEPVGSRFLVEKAGLDWSEATVRNELRTLEEAGFLTHPHTSAGRIPTCQGYHYYLTTINFGQLELPRSESVALERSVKGGLDYEMARKSIAKTLVTLSQETVLIAFSEEVVYYTGLANLFQKPDFAELELVASVSEVFDRCEETLPKFFSMVKDEPKYFLGDEHPFGEMLSIVSMRFGKDNESLIAILGPQRMDYKHNYQLMNKVREVI